MHPDAFTGTPRFRLVRRLGRGGYGAVFLAQDLERDMPVALKLLTNMQSGSLYRFKQEFRSLADLHHPNLVRLYELLSEADQWFFTMEMIEGVDFHQHVRRTSRVVDDPDTPTMTTAEAHSSTFSGGGPLQPYDPATLRAALRQLTHGVQALHDAGNLHRDLKPPNVLVTAEGRVVILDFGLVIELDDAGVAESVSLTGTPLYMSPEQSAGLPMSAASDWYSVGLMLYAVLAGGLPFSGSIADVIRQKRVWTPAASHLPAGTPEDLAAICIGLLQLEPARRMGALDVLACLGSASDAPVEKPPVRTRAPGVFVGRDAHLAVLTAALDDVRSGTPATVLLSGSSGIGKTTMVRRFLEDVRHGQSEAIILRARCYERESVPYKALDGLVDALVQYIRRLPIAELPRVLPRDLPVLERLFPSVSEISERALPVRSTQVADPSELRRRGGRALRELVARLADLAPLVMFVDDIHWGDVDSARLLQEVLRPPDVPPVLLIVSYRAEEAETSPCVRELVAFGRSVASEIGLRELGVGELSLDESEALARSMLGEAAADGQAAAVVARECEGIPFFIRELVLQRKDAERRSEPTEWPAPAGSLDDFMAARLLQLHPDCRTLLEFLAVAGRPLERTTLVDAAKIPRHAAALDTLAEQSLLRSRRSEASDALELYHGRMATGILAHVSSETLRTRHGDLAAALERSGRADPETLFGHYHEAGERARAAAFGVAAAEQAWKALAFNRAADLYAGVLDDLPPDEPSVPDIRTRLGDALARAGRGEEAAHAYLAAIVAQTPPGRRLQLRQKAVGQLFRTGRFDEGLAALRDLLPALHLKWPVSTRSALASYILRRLQLRLRGLSFREQSDIAPTDERLVHIDVCFSLSTGLSVVDPLRARLFQTRGLLWALDAGEPLRIARAVALEATFSAVAGGRTRAQTDELFRRAEALAERANTPEIHALVVVGKGVAFYLRGEWRASVEMLTRAEKLLVEHCVDVVQELDNARVFALTSLTYLGEVREVRARLPGLLADAHERRDLFAETMLELRTSVMDLVSDDPARARARATAAIARWSSAEFHATHYSALQRQIEIDLYTGDGASAVARLEAAAPGFRRSLLLRNQTTRIETWFLRGRASVAAAGAGRNAAPLLAAARRAADAIDAQRMPWAEGLALLLRAGVAVASDRAEAAVPILADAERRFEAAGMKLHAAAARRRRGELTGGATGRALIDDADAWMAAQGIAKPSRMTAVLAPKGSSE